MASMLPVAVYGLKVPAGDVVIPATVNFPATFRITMAAIDPSAKPERGGTAASDIPPRATLKMVYDQSGASDQDSEGSDEEDDYIQALQEGRESDGLSDEDDDDEDEDSDDEEKNGGPSDPSKSKKARKEAAVQNLMKALEEQNGADESEDDMDVDVSPKVNGIAKKPKTNKGKGKATEKASDKDEDSEDEEEIESDESLDGMEEVVICTLDPEKTCQQPIDITIPEDQPTYFKVSGTHAIYLTGNYVIPQDDGHGSEDDDEEAYDLSPDEDELDVDDEDESDALDNLEDPRITEVGSDDESEAPQLVKKPTVPDKSAKKGKNKRPAEDSEEDSKAGASLDDIMTKSLKAEEVKVEEPKVNGEQKLSKKQLKKLKNNAGKAVEAYAESKEVKKEEGAVKGDKKVQFATNLEQAPTSSASTVKEVNGDAKPPQKKEENKQKSGLGIKTVQGVKIDDRKVGEGPIAKKGDRVSMRYIGKLDNGKIFDANKRGAPFKFKLGTEQVIKGWDIGVAGMSVNGERRIVIPSKLAYGSKAQKGIPANSELTFDIKLLEIN